MNSPLIQNIPLEAGSILMAMNGNDYCLLKDVININSVEYIQMMSVLSDASPGVRF